MFEYIEIIVAMLEEKDIKEKSDKKKSSKMYILSVGDFICCCSKPDFAVTDKVVRFFSDTN